MTKVVVKWGSKTINAICDPTQPVSAFMATLEAETGVPVARQKLTMRRQQIKLDGNWAQGQIKEGAILMLIGTAEPSPPPPPELPVEVEEQEVVPEGDLSSAEYAKINVGLPNFALNCYLNAVLQTLRLLPGLTNALLPITNGGADPVTCLLARFLCDFGKVNLMALWTALCRAGPELFGKKDEETGQPMMQDAPDVWRWMIAQFKSVPQIRERIRDLFDIDMKIVQDCPETGEHEERIETLGCIGISIDEDVRELAQGIRLDATVEKKCNLNKDSVWTDKRRIVKLPRYFIFNMLRYIYKQDEKVIAKVLRRVIHPIKFDTLLYLEPALKAKIIAEREAGNEKAGKYHLISVLTHRGRLSRSGHWITHVKVKNHWFRFDDMKVSEVEESDIDQLSGSADWHTSAYIIYEAD